MEQLGQVHFARKTLVPTLILRNSPKLSHQCFVAALQLATGVRFPHGSRLLFRQDLRLGGMLTRPRSAPGRDTISCPYICLCMCLCLCVSYIEFTWAVDADVVAVDKANWLSANSPSRRRHSAWLCRSCSEVCGRKVVRWGSLLLWLLCLLGCFYASSLWLAHSSVIFRLVADEIYLYFCCLNLNIDYQEDNSRKKCRISRSKVQSRPLDTFLRSGGIPAAWVTICLKVGSAETELLFVYILHKCELTNNFKYLLLVLTSWRNGCY